jgi:MOSC domain-containing protein YiiM
MAQVASVNAGRARTIWWRDRTVTTAIWKAPVPGRVPVRGVNLAAIVQEGEVAAGDPVEVVHRPDHQVDVRTVARAYHADRSLVPRLLEVPELPPSWREWADAHLPDQPRRRSG